MLPDHGVKWGDMMDEGETYTVALWIPDEGADTAEDLRFVESAQDGNVLVFRDEDGGTIFTANRYVVGVARQERE